MRFLRKITNPGHKKKSEVKTSKLDIQYTKLLVWVVWPEEPSEIHFFEKCSEFGSQNFQKNMKNGPKWVGNRRILMKINANEAESAN